VRVSACCQNALRAVVGSPFTRRGSWYGNVSSVPASISLLLTSTYRVRKVGLAHDRDNVTVITWAACMIKNLKPAGTCISFWYETRGHIDGDLEPETYFPHVHLVIPRVARICPLDEPRVKHEPHPYLDVARSHIVVSLTRQVPRLQVPYCILDSRPTLVLNDWISMKFEERILEILLILSRDGAVYSVHYLSPGREARSLPFH
jgi:hypothetical protein